MISDRRPSQPCDGQPSKFSMGADDRAIPLRIRPSTFWDFFSGRWHRRLCRAGKHVRKQQQRRQQQRQQRRLYLPRISKEWTRCPGFRQWMSLLWLTRCKFRKLIKQKKLNLKKELYKTKLKLLHISKAYALVKLIFKILYVLINNLYNFRLA